jgi:hypothetical protein
LENRVIVSLIFKFLAAGVGNFQTNAYRAEECNISIQASNELTK